MLGEVGCARQAVPGRLCKPKRDITNLGVDTLGQNATETNNI
jgi:hypothetical protein